MWPELIEDGGIGRNFSFDRHVVLRWLGSHTRPLTGAGVELPRITGRRIAPRNPALRSIDVPSLDSTPVPRFSSPFAELEAELEMRLSPGKRHCRTSRWGFTRSRNPSSAGAGVKGRRVGTKPVLSFGAFASSIILSTAGVGGVISGQLTHRGRRSAWRCHSPPVICVGLPWKQGGKPSRLMSWKEVLEVGSCFFLPSQHLITCRCVNVCVNLF